MGLIVKRFASEDYVDQNLQNFKYEVILTTPILNRRKEKNQVKENLGITIQYLKILILLLQNMFIPMMETILLILILGS